MKKLATLASAGFMATALAHGQTLTPGAFVAKGPNGVTDTYVGAFSTAHTFAPVKGSEADRWFGNWSLKADGFVGMGMQYKLNIATVDLRLNWAVTPRFSLYGLWEQPGDINNFSLSQLNLKSGGPGFGVAWGFM